MIRHAAFDTEVGIKGRGVIEPFLVSLAKTSNPITLRECNQIHTKLIVSQCISQTHLTNTLLNLYAKFGHFRHAHLLFDKMPHRNVVTWTTLISAHLRTGSLPKAFEMFNHMRAANERPNEDLVTWNVMITGFAHVGDFSMVHRLFSEMWGVQGLKPDDSTFVSLLKCCSSLEELKQTHGLVAKFGAEVDVVVGSALVDLYAKCGDVSSCWKVFDSMEEKDSFVWSSIISGYTMNNRGEEAVNFFKEMCRQRVRPDQHVLSIAVLKSCENKSDLPAGRQIHSLIVKSSLSHHTLVGNALVHMYTECGQIGDAFKAFVDIVYKDDGSWSSIIGTYKQNGMKSEALELCREMLADGITFTSYSLPLCISACSQLSALNAGKQLHIFAIKCGYNDDVYVGSSIIDMYAKCGTMEESEKVFGEQVEPNEVIYNALICGYAHHGKAQEAIEVFEKLEKNGLTPNHVTFLAVLSACSHSGYVEDTLYFFTLMINKYKIMPESEHYSCLVDAYGRAGRLEEAYRIVQKDGRESAWRTLLSACRNHNNTKIGEKCAMKMLELNPTDHASYILLSNIYIGEGKWEEALKCREKMAKIRVKKDPGSSWLI
uniref:Pentatricopeptide repeat-containing protein At2g13600 family n=1 Tax=Cajanus cajan TaxID=3821 RepID=A0A151THP0_CAJCA|nr:Pentatricopeptide repeat-containing protein At2g13600 family [Cajanus cajan]